MAVYSSTARIVCWARATAIALLLMLLPGAALADSTPILSAPAGEPDLDQPDGILDQLYGLENLVRLEDFGTYPNDQLWAIFGPAGATATARFAGLTQNFGYFPGEDPAASFVWLFEVTETGFLNPGPSASFGPEDTGSTFRFGANPSSGDTWSTRQSDNSDGSDHMVTWLIAGNEPHTYNANPSNPVGSYAIAWEDLPLATSDWDFNDLVIEITSVTPAECGDGTVSNGEECDDGNTSDGDCCSSTCQIEPAGAVCRPSVGACDLEETCDGLSGVCPADLKSTAVCRPSAGICDVAESCDGVNDDCPADAKSTAVCRPSAGACDVAESCDGASDGCPADGYATGSVCRVPAGACDVAESCDGLGPNCPADGFEPATTVCRASGGVCDLEETCDGVSATCPTDTKSTAECRASAGVCDVPEVCDGVNDDCPADGYDSGTECRPSAGTCDVAESCDGSGPDCPGDAKSTAECRAAADVCDVAEFCDGASDDCPADGFAPAATVCRAAAGVCDVEELCPGTGPTCPADVYVTDGTACPDGDVCNGFESCWSGSCVSGTPLDCDDRDICTADSCDPISGCQNPPISCDDSDACTADSCDPALGCQHDPITCDDASVCTADSCDPVLGCQYDPISCDDGDICTVDSCDPISGCQNPPISCDDGNACTDDFCDPVSGCQHTPAVDGTSCADANECNGAETCIGGVCSPGAPLADGTPCGDGNPCNGDDTCLAEVCVGGTPPPDGTPCSDGNACNGLEACWGEVCAPGEPLDCDDGDPCTADSCDQVAGCVHEPIPDCGNPTEAVVPLLECVDDNGDGTYTAYFSYRNDNAVPVTIPVGADNFFDPPPVDRGQPELFAEGRSPFLPNVAFTVEFDGSPLVWTLEGPDDIPRSSTASASSSPCPYFDVGTQSICYRALRTRGTPKPEKTTALSFEDQFQEKLFDIADHKMVCTPATVLTTTSVTGPIDPEAHTGGRKMWRTRTKPPQPFLGTPGNPNHHQLLMTDVFGTISIDVKRDYRVLLETAICDPGAELCPFDASVLDTSELDPDRVLSCYRVALTPGTPSFEKLNFVGSDRFQTQAYRATRPRMLCSLASVDGGNPEALTNPTYQLCYRIFVASSFCEVGSPPGFALQTCKKHEDCGGGQCVTYPKPFSHQRIPDLQMNNRFGPETLQTFYEEMICLDAIVTP